MRAALAMLRPASANWQPPVLTASAKGEGRRAAMTDFWRTLLNYRDTLAASGELAAKRRRQSRDWMWTMIDAGLRRRFREHPAVHSALPSLARAVEAGATTPTAAAHKLLNLLNRFF